MNVYEIFKDQNVCISPLLNKPSSFSVRLTSGNVQRFEDTCEYYFKDVKRFKNGNYNITWSHMCYGDQHIDCSKICIEDVPAMIIDDYMELDEDGDNAGQFYGVFDFDEVYRDCNHYDDEWRLEYFKHHFSGATVTRYKDAEYNKVYTFDLELDPIRVYNIEDGKNTRFNQDNRGIK